jgi:GrpB-like predicted nucleotidyltransferase (UPF0157 family)
MEGSRNEGRHAWLSYPSVEHRECILHLVYTDDDEWTRRITFRDQLRADPEKARAYQQLKRSLATAYPGHLEAYTRGKADFVRSVIQGPNIST